MNQKFAYIWEYQVKENFLQPFKNAYGPDGEWVKLFKKGRGYLFTHLHCDRSNPQRFITVDFWESENDRDNFRIEFSEEFKLLDQFCEQFTEAEIFLGDFNCDFDH